MGCCWPRQRHPASRPRAAPEMGARVAMVSPRARGRRGRSLGGRLWRRGGGGGRRAGAPRREKTISRLPFCQRAEPVRFCPAQQTRDAVPWWSRILGPALHRRGGRRSAPPRSAPSPSVAAAQPRRPPPPCAQPFRPTMADTPCRRGRAGTAPSPHRRVGGGVGGERPPHRPRRVRCGGAPPPSPPRTAAAVTGVGAGAAGVAKKGSRPSWCLLPPPPPLSLPHGADRLCRHAPRSPCGGQTAGSPSLDRGGVA